MGGSIYWRWGVGTLPAKSLPAQGVGACIPGQRGHSLTVLFISVMQEMHQGHVPPVPHIKGESKDRNIAYCFPLFCNVYVGSIEGEKFPERLFSFLDRIAFCMLTLTLSFPIANAVCP